MGDPKFARRKYETPSHPWQSDRIKLENDLVHKFALKNKKEVWKAQSYLRRLRQHARFLIAQSRAESVQAQVEAKELLTKVHNLGFLEESATLDDILAMDVEMVLTRRLQTQVYLKGLAHTPKQARQFIIHGHTSVGNRRVTIPSYIVSREEEKLIQYSPTSPLTNELHPMVPKADQPAVAQPDTQVKGKVNLATKEPPVEERPKEEGEQPEKEPEGPSEEPPQDKDGT